MKMILIDSSVNLKRINEYDCKDKLMSILIELDLK